MARLLQVARFLQVILRKNCSRAHARPERSEGAGGGKGTVEEYDLGPPYPGEQRVR